MDEPIIFHLSERRISNQAGVIKVLYVDSLTHWNLYHELSALPVAIPLEAQYHLGIGEQIMNNVYQMNDSTISKQDFINSGFIEDITFEKMFNDYSENQK